MSRVRDWLRRVAGADDHGSVELITEDHPFRPKIVDLEGKIVDHGHEDRLYKINFPEDQLPICPVCHFRAMIFVCENDHRFTRPRSTSTEGKYGQVRQVRKYGKYSQ